MIVSGQMSINWVVFKITRCVAKLQSVGNFCLDMPITDKCKKFFSLGGENVFCRNSL